MRLISDAVWAILTIWCEARGEPYEGKVAVAEVIRNRMARKYNSDGTCIGTILRPRQFSCWNTDDPNRLLAAKLDDSDRIVGDCKMAWVESERSSLVHGAVLYLNPNVIKHLPQWAEKVTLITKIGSHQFYTDP